MVCGVIAHYFICFKLVEGFLVLLFAEQNENTKSHSINKMKGEKTKAVALSPHCQFICVRYPCMYQAGVYKRVRAFITNAAKTHSFSLE